MPWRGAGIVWVALMPWRGAGIVWVAVMPWRGAGIVWVAAMTWRGPGIVWVAAMWCALGVGRVVIFVLPLGRMSLHRRGAESGILGVDSIPRT